MQLSIMHSTTRILNFVLSTALFVSGNALADKPKTIPKGVNAGDRYVLNVKLDNFPGFSVNLRWCPPSQEFIIGSPANGAGRESGRGADEGQTKIPIKKGFWIAETECSQFLWFAIMRSYPPTLTGPPAPKNFVSGAEATYANTSLPITGISRDMAGQFLGKMQALNIFPDGMEVWLPTEAQWEYACRAGTKGAYAGNFQEICWHGGKANGHLGQVGSVKMTLVWTDGKTRQMKVKPNPWGIFDMHGNVAEYCCGKYGPYPFGATQKGFYAGAIPLRGGSAVTSGSERWWFRSAARKGYPSNLSLKGNGFRFVLNYR